VSNASSPPLPPHDEPLASARAAAASEVGATGEGSTSGTAAGPPPPKHHGSEPAVHQRLISCAPDFWPAGEPILDDEELLDLVGPLWAPAHRQLIQLEGGTAHTTVDEVNDAIRAAGGADLFQRGTTIVRLARVRDPSAAAHERGGSMRILQVDWVALCDRLNRIVHWKKWDVRRNEWKDTDCPRWVAETYGSRVGTWSLRHLTGIVHAPTLRADGSLIARGGYDKSSCLYVDLRGIEFEPVAEAPTKEDARAAALEVLKLVDEFPFIADSDRSAFLAMCQTMLVRHLFPCAPMFVIRATRRGTGKSLLVDIASIIATGRPAAVMPPVKDEEEARKRFLSVLMEAVPVSALDNCVGELGGPTLCQIISQPVFRDRMLGTNQTVVLPTNTTTVVATGNNLVLTGDLSRRVIPCDLDSAREFPEERSFAIADIRTRTLEERPRLVRHLLTILRAYNAAGRPAISLSAYGGFEPWSNVIRASLVWTGLADPCEGRARLERIEPDAVALRRVLACWDDEFGRDETSAANLISKASERQDGDLFRALREVAADRKEGVCARRLGRWLQAHVGQVAGDLRIKRSRESKSGALWRLAAANDPGGMTGFPGYFQPTLRSSQGAATSLYGGGTYPLNPDNPPAKAKPDRSQTERSCQVDADCAGPHECRWPQICAPSDSMPPSGEAASSVDGVAPPQEVPNDDEPGVGHSTGHRRLEERGRE